MVWDAAGNGDRNNKNSKTTDSNTNREEDVDAMTVRKNRRANFIRTGKLK